jgi:hypothetical protein
VQLDGHEHLELASLQAGNGTGVPHLNRGNPIRPVALNPVNDRSVRAPVNVAVALPKRDGRLAVLSLNAADDTNTTERTRRLG